MADGRKKFKAIIEYEGTDFSGFQWQHGVRTVQGSLEEAINSRCVSASRVTGAGRTDAGVHALGQVISFTAETRIPSDKMAIALNSALPMDLRIRHVEAVEESFNARFSASSRAYAYLVLNRSSPSAILRRFSAFVPAPLEVEKMQLAADLLVGERDYASFTNELNPEMTTMRAVKRFRVNRRKQLVIVRIEANAFLRGMVRNLVGTLLLVGQGKIKPDAVEEILASKDRKVAGPTAPAQGLCLMKVRYGHRKDYGAAIIEEID